jgi:hypothetical protein
MISSGYDVRKSRIASETYINLRSPLRVRARATKATTKTVKYVTIQSWLANLKLKRLKRLKKGTDVGG